MLRKTIITIAISAAISGALALAPVDAFARGGGGGAVATEGVGVATEGAVVVTVAGGRWSRWWVRRWSRRRWVRRWSCWRWFAEDMVVGSAASVVAVGSGSGGFRGGAISGFRGGVGGFRAATLSGGFRGARFDGLHGRGIRVAGFRRHRGFPIAAGLGFGGWGYYNSCIVWTGYNWVNVCY